MAVQANRLLHDDFGVVSGQSLSCVHDLGVDGAFLLVLRAVLLFVLRVLFVDHLAVLEVLDVHLRPDGVVHSRLVLEDAPAEVVLRVLRLLGRGSLLSEAWLLGQELLLWEQVGHGAGFGAGETNDGETQVLAAQVPRLVASELQSQLRDH